MKKVKKVKKVMSESEKMLRSIRIAKPIVLGICIAAILGFLAGFVLMIIGVAMSYVNEGVLHVGHIIISVISLAAAVGMWFLMQHCRLTFVRMVDFYS